MFSLWALIGVTFGVSPMKAVNSPFAEPLRAHPALPASQQHRINAWIESMPIGCLGTDDMPDLIELARHMDRAERITREIVTAPNADPCPNSSLADLLAAEEARIRALSSRLQMSVNRRGFRGSSIL